MKTKKILTIIFTALGLTVGLPTALALAEPSEIEKLQKAVEAAQVAGDTGFMLICAALVLLMTPGLAFFYGGFVARRNILNTLMMSFLLMGIVGVTWVLWGYSLAFSPGNPILGGLEWLFLNGVKADPGYYIPKDLLAPLGNLGALFVDPAGAGSYSPTIPHQAFMIYQGMFAIITPALISGAIVERVSFKAYALFVLLWSTFIYIPLAHMVWGVGGLLGLNGGMGALDFAGGTVVHISSGVSALVAAIVIGKRRTYPDRLSAPHNVPFILLGAGLLWFGWFGFNAGSALASGSLATVAFVNTNTAAAAAMLMWLTMEQVLRGNATAVGAATGAVAGLVGITPAAGFVDPISAILIGAITAFCCFFAISAKVKFGLDDALDTYPVHGVGGTIGAILTGVFATKEVNSAGADGLLRGNVQQFITQIIAVLIAYAVAAIGTVIILKIVEVLVGLRLQPEQEFQGMDINEHGEEGYGEEFGGGVPQMGKVSSHQ